MAAPTARPLASFSRPLGPAPVANSLNVHEIGQGARHGLSSPPAPAADQLTLYDTTQAVASSGYITATHLGISPLNVRVVAHFIGGAFGAKGILWGYQTLAVVAARQLRRPVKLVLSGQQMVTSVGHRGETVQRVELGAETPAEIAPGVVAEPVVEGSGGVGRG